MSPEGCCTQYDVDLYSYQHWRMTDYEISVKETRPFLVRIRRRLYVSLVMPVFTIISTFIHCHWVFGSIVALVFFLMAFIPVLPRHIIFITKIVATDAIVTIYYKEFNSKKQMARDIKDFTAKFASPYGRNGLHLKIYYKGYRVLRQYDVDEWTKYRLEQVIAGFKS